MIRTPSSPVSTSPLSAWKTPFAIKTPVPKEDVDADGNNNSIAITVSAAQVDAYSPIEDRMYVNEKDHLFAVFDGHGGDICSRYVVDRLPKQLLSCLKKRPPKSNCDYDHLLKMSFMQVDEQFLQEHKTIVRTSPAGSCGVTVLIRNDTLYVCNVGDSRVLLGSRQLYWSHKLLTNDHNTKNEKERELVKARTTDPFPLRTHISSKVEGDRIGGILMVTRAFGDGIFKRRDMSLAPLIHHLPYITSEPEITIHKLTPNDKYVIISSDGLYEYLTPAAVAEFVEKQLQSGTEPSTLAGRIIELQFETIAKMMNKSVDQVKRLPNRKTFMDDTTVIVLVLKPPYVPPPAPAPTTTPIPIRFGTSPAPTYAAMASFGTSPANTFGTSPGAARFGSFGTSPATSGRVGPSPGSSPATPRFGVSPAPSRAIAIPTTSTTSFSASSSSYTSSTPIGSAGSGRYGASPAASRFGVSPAASRAIAIPTTSNASPPITPGNNPRGISPTFLSNPPRGI